MMRFAVVVLIASASAALPSGASQRAAARTPKVSTVEKCAAELGVGVTTGRRFCDVVVAVKAVDSVAVTIPPHRGSARLLFDLHNRVAVPLETAQKAQTFARNTAVISVVGPKGEIGKAVAISEFRTAADLFDRIVGGAGPGGVKSVGPGPATPIDVTIPAGQTSFGIVGVRLEVVTRLGKQTYDTPGRPIAVVSNVRVEYSPLR